METMQQIFMIIIATFPFLILIVKIVSAGDTNDDGNRRRRKSKSKKKVRFAIDHEEFVTGKVIVEPAETESVVFDDTIAKVTHVVDKDQFEMICEEHVDKNSLCVKLSCDADEIDEDEKEKQGLISDEDDDWEGIEPSDSEKVFAVAVNKVATEGPCYETQPITLD